MTRRALLLLLLVLAATPACGRVQRAVTGQPPAWSASKNAWTRIELYFGLQDRHGQSIPDDAWETFVAQAITPRFPDGLTIVPVQGQYRNEKGEVLREPSRLVVLLVPPRQNKAAAASVRAITATWCERFNQESVLRTDSPARVMFMTAGKPDR